MNKELRIKRLVYQSCHRGCKETDFLLGNFAKEKVAGFSDEQLSQYESFINEDDWDIYAWLTGKLPFPERHDNNTIKLLREFEC